MKREVFTITVFLSDPHKRGNTHAKKLLLDVNWITSYSYAFLSPNFVVYLLPLS